jgi:L-seryl-tRNA(Ser) seleniumtransferase
VAEQLKTLPGLEVSVTDDVAYVGSGSIPDEGIPSKVVRLTHAKIPADELARRLRLGLPSVFGRLQDRTLVLDMRTLLPGELELLVTAVKAAADRGN